MTASEVVSRYSMDSIRQAVIQMRDNSITMCYRESYLKATLDGKEWWEPEYQENVKKVEKTVGRPVVPTASVEETKQLLAKQAAVQKADPEIKAASIAQIKAILCGAKGCQVVK
ncbi:MAG: hypothetical protein ABIP54_02000 [Candidatus Andersenbacteria bacterium]